MSKKENAKKSVKKNLQVVEKDKYELTKIRFEQLCNVKSTEKEIISFFGTTKKDLEAFVKKTYGTSLNKAIDRFSDGGNIQLREAMHYTAIEDRNPQMQKFLAKQYLGYTDSVEITNKHLIEEDPFTKAITSSLENIGIEQEEDE